MYNIGTSLVAADYSCRRISLAAPPRLITRGGWYTQAKTRGAPYQSEMVCSELAFRTQGGVFPECLSSSALRCESLSTSTNRPRTASVDSCRMARCELQARSGESGALGPRVSQSGVERHMDRRGMLACRKNEQAASARGWGGSHLRRGGRAGRAPILVAVGASAAPSAAGLVRHRLDAHQIGA